MYDANTVMPHTVVTIEAGQTKDNVLLWEQADGSGLKAGTTRIDAFADAAHSTLSGNSDEFYVEYVKGCHLEKAPPGDNPPGTGGGGTVRPPDATGDLKVLPKRKNQKGFKVRTPWDATGIDHASKFQVMVQPPKKKTPIWTFTVEPGEVDSAIVKYKREKAWPKGTRIRLWVEHPETDYGPAFMKCVDEVIVGKRRSGCRA